MVRRIRSVCKITR